MYLVHKLREIVSFLLLPPLPVSLVEPRPVMVESVCQPAGLPQIAYCLMTARPGQLSYGLYSWYLLNTSYQYYNENQRCSVAKFNGRTIYTLPISSELARNLVDILFLVLLQFPDGRTRVGPIALEAADTVHAVVDRSNDSARRALCECAGLVGTDGGGSRYLLQEPRIRTRAISFTAEMNASIAASGKHSEKSTMTSV